MSLSAAIVHPPLSWPRTQQKLPILTRLICSPQPKLLSIKSLQTSQEQPSSPAHKPRWEALLDSAASLYPVYVTVGGAVACVKPSAFSWFVSRGPASYTLSLGFIMLAMGLTLKLKDFFTLLMQRPQSVTLIAQGDVPLSIVMTMGTTLAAVVLTPLLTQFLAGAYIHVDAIGLSVSTLQVLVAPILVGSYIQSKFPSIVKLITPFAPLLAVLTSSLLASSVLSENVVRLKSTMLVATAGSGSGPPGVQRFLPKEMGAVVLSVLLLHFAGFLVGYLSAATAGFKEPQRRAISIEVGMQNSALGVVLATTHFTSPLVALPPAMSAVLMNIMGSSLGFIWRYIDSSNHKK